MAFRLLILGGTGEARDLAQRIGAAFGPSVDLVYSLAGRTAAPLLPTEKTRRGGFGGPAGLAEYLSVNDCHAVIDATHPFARRISENASHACAAVGLPLLSLDRASWRQETDDDWTDVDGLDGAAAQLRRGPWSRALITTGRTGIESLGGLHGVFLLVRLISAPARPLPLMRHEIVLDRGPFTVAAETALIRDRRIEVLVTKASGGGATRAKLLAARALGLPVIMLRRPIAAGQPAPGATDALVWLDDRLRERRNADSRKCIVDDQRMPGQEKG